MFNQNIFSFQKRLRLNFEMPSSNTSDKVPVEVVKQVFSQRYPAENNTTFGKVVREAFPNIKRSRDNINYNYAPLRLILNKQPFSNIEEKEQNSDLLEANSDRTAPIESKKKEFEPEDANARARETLERVSELEKQNKVLQDKINDLEKNSKTQKRGKEIIRSLSCTLRAKRVKLDVSSRSVQFPVVNKISPSDLKVIGSERPLGEGTFGICRVKKFVRTGTLVAVKEMKYSCLSSVLREARVMQAVTHRSFPFIFGVQLQQNPYSIVMEFKGCRETFQSFPLCRVLKEKSETTRQIREKMKKNNWIQFCIDIAEGIEHLHSLGYLHCDLKTDNVLIHEERGFIIDFGKACAATSPPCKKNTTESSTVIAPEVLKGQPYSFSSDIYSLGRIFEVIRKCCGVKELRDTEKDCTSSNYVMRPSASIVTTKLKELFSPKIGDPADLPNFTSGLQVEVLDDLNDFNKTKTKGDDFEVLTT